MSREDRHHNAMIVMFILVIMCFATMIFVAFM